MSNEQTAKNSLKGNLAMEEQYVTLGVTTSPTSIRFNFDHRDSNPGTRDFYVQVQDWMEMLPAKLAEEAFLGVYLPEAEIIPDAGLTEGLVFSYKGYVFWDNLYQVRNFLQDLLLTGEVLLICAGTEKDLHNFDDDIDEENGDSPNDWRQEE